MKPYFKDIFDWCSNRRIYYDCYGEQVERYNISSTTTIKNSVYAINAIKHLYLRTKAALMNSVLVIAGPGLRFSKLSKRFL